MSGQVRPILSFVRDLLRATTSVFALVLVLAASGAGAQDSHAPPDSLGLAAISEDEYFLLGADRRPLTLAHGAVDAASFQLSIGGRAWQVDVDFRLRSRTGIVVPLRPWSESGFVYAVASYRFRPGMTSPRIGIRSMVPPPREHGAQDDQTRQDLREVWNADTIGDLQVRGSKSVSVSSGTNNEMAVDQNLRLSVAGQLTQDIHVRAVLTDDNLPVVPEGNTEELQDIDKVLVELRAPIWRATLGDFVARRSGSRFGGYRRKLQGFTFTAEPGVGLVEGLFGSPRGRYRTVEIRGEDSNQGPYHLGAGDAGQNLFVVAGSERVTLDGGRLTRGQDKDYVIDYVRGTVTFTYRRLVTAESLITVEFEEGEGPFARSVVGGGGGARGTWAGLPASLVARVTREADDPGRMRSGEFSAEDEVTLAAAGDDPLLAVARGETQTEAGAGRYRLVPNGEEPYYEVAPDGGDWDVVFFYAGLGLGDYDLASISEAGERLYQWVGEGSGSYRVGRQLPVPTSQSLLSLVADLGDSSVAAVHAEWHVSAEDGNVLSSRDDSDNDGQAGQVAVHSGPLDLARGVLTVAGSWEQRGARFSPFEVAKTVYEYERWGLGERARREGFLEQLDREYGGQATWAVGSTNQRLELDAVAGRLDHGDALHADRLTASGRWNWRGGRGHHVWRRATSEDQLDPLDILRVDHDHDVRWRVGPVVPRTAFLRRSWADDAATGARASGYRLEEITAGLASDPRSGWRWDLAFTHGIADSLHDGSWEHERDSRTWHAGATTPRVAGIRLVADGTSRQVIKPDGNDETTRLARIDLAASWAELGSDWSLGYALDNSRTEVLARQVVFVGIGEGRYDEAGVFVGENRGDFDLILAGTDSLVATTAVRADLTWRQDMGVLGKERLWTAWTSQTRVSAEARSQTDEIGRLLLLDPGVVFDDELAVLGRIDFSEEVTFLRHLRAWDLRWRFDFNETRDRQYAQGRQDRLERAHLATLTWNPLATLSLRIRGGQTDARRETESEFNPTQLSYEARTRRLETEGSWRPVAGTRAALSVETITRDDAWSGVSQREWALAPSLRWRVRRNWSLQSELRLAGVASDEPPGARRPYFFPSAGANVESSTRVSWEPSRYLSMAVAWFGRKPGGLEWQHDLRLESTARF